MDNHSGHKTSKSLLALTVGSIGMVYGDIGTSPLYAFSESIKAASDGGAISQPMVIGVLSLILWALFVIVTLKYVTLLLRADNNGEGGILSLMALANNSTKNAKAGVIITGLGIVGAALFYGDSIITPAISVLSAVEGLKTVTHTFDHVVIPIAITIIILLFMVQRKGTDKVSKFFGPVMMVWFLAMALGGIRHIHDNPTVLQAFNPYHAIYFVTNHGVAGLIALGAVFLAVTGAEALYADLGHFGKKPVRLAWASFVMPSLVLNYLGQAALILKQPEAASNSFFLLYPEWAAVPMIILATLATVIASQAVITGAYSLTHQAVQLGILPRMTVVYTSEDNIGQIYLPQVNWLLMVFIILVMLLFRSSSALASAYGIAVTGTMVITAILTFIVMRNVWKWKLAYCLSIITPLLIIDLTFLTANMAKFVDGGYMPVLFSSILIVMMRVWIKGCKLLYNQSGRSDNINELVKLLDTNPPKRVPGTAIFFSSNSTNAPAALLHNLKHNKVLHEQNILITINFANQPALKDSKRMQIKKVGQDFVRVNITFGYMEPTNILKAIKLLKKAGYKIDTENTSFFISRRHIVATAKLGMPYWQDRLFIAMASNASDASEYFQIPRDRVVELGVQVYI